jgi:hypothetical protein
VKEKEEAPSFLGMKTWLHGKRRGDDHKRMLAVGQPVRRAAVAGERVKAAWHADDPGSIRLGGGAPCDDVAVLATQWAGEAPDVGDTTMVRWRPCGIPT